MNKITNKPTLRFPEFNDEWEVKNFSEKFSFFSTNSFSRELLNYKNGSIKNIHYGDIHTKFKTNFDITKEKVPYINSSIDLSKINNECYCKLGDLVIADASEDYKDIGKTIEIRNLDNQKLLSGLHTYIARDTSSSFAIGFMGYLMQTKNIRLQMMKMATGISVLGISKGNLGKIKINIPSKEEQTKIANFLTLVDTKIDQLTKKKELLESYKKSVMQKIFSQEIRFKDDNGNDYPDWEEKKSNEIFCNHTNKNHNGDLPILAVTQDKGVVLRGSINIEIKSSEQSIKSYKIIEKGDFVISLRSFQGGIEYSYVTGISSPAYTVLKNKIPINDIFFKNYLKKESFIEELSSTVIGIRDGKQISFDAFSTLILPYPCLEEQTKIANFLISIDKKIELVNTELENLKVWKQGLLQQMFI